MTFWTVRVIPSVWPGGGVPSSQSTLKIVLKTGVPLTCSWTSSTSWPPSKLEGNPWGVASPKEWKARSFSTIHVPAPLTSPEADLWTKLPLPAAVKGRRLKVPPPLSATSYPDWDVWVSRIQVAVCRRHTIQLTCLPRLLLCRAPFELADMMRYSELLTGASSSGFYANTITTSRHREILREATAPLFAGGRTYHSLTGTKINGWNIELVSHITFSLDISLALYAKSDLPHLRGLSTTLWCKVWSWKTFWAINLEDIG